MVTPSCWSDPTVASACAPTTVAHPTTRCTCRSRTSSPTCAREPMPRLPSAQAVLLTAADCELCEHAKKVLQRVASEHPLDIRTVSLDSTEGQELAARNPVLFAPGLLLDGKMLSYGRV